MQEDSVHDRDWNDLPPGVKLPPCVREKAGFMRPTEFTVPITHPYSSWSPAHEGLKPLPLRFPAWSAPCVPLRWMNRKSAEEIAAARLIDYEPLPPAMSRRTRRPPPVVIARVPIRGVASSAW